MRGADSGEMGVERSFEHIVGIIAGYSVFMNKPISYASVAHLYDACVNTQFDVPFFLAEAKEAQGKVLELASGTGRVSLPLLEAGIDLTCVDYSKEMLAILRRKLDEQHRSCRVVHQDMSELTLPDRFNLIFIPFHSFSELLDADKQRKALRKIREHLADRGRFICTLQNPVVRTGSMDGNTRELGRFPLGEGRTLTLSACFTYDDHSQVAGGIQSYSVRDARGKMIENIELPVSFKLHHRVQFEEMALAAGFGIVSLFGTYERSGFDKGQSPFMIWALEKAGD
jgi:SAM-dependent methyltransferase